jgi:hypothetical protein
MDWIQFFIFFVGVFGLFIWNRAEGRADARKAEERDEQLRTTMAANALENRQLIASIHKEIQQEMKDFHGRLCTIEERHREK